MNAALDLRDILAEAAVIVRDARPDPEHARLIEWWERPRFFEETPERSHLVPCRTCREAVHETSVKRGNCLACRMIARDPNGARPREWLL